MVDTALLLLRVTTGIVLGGLGVQKLFGWFATKTDSANHEGAFARHSFRLVIGWAQAAAGLFLALGVWPFGSAILLAMSIAGLQSRRWRQGLWGDVSRGIPAVLAGIAVVLAFVGPGRYSVASSIGWKTYDQAVSSFQPGGPIDRSPADQGLAKGNAAISQCAGPSLKGIGVRPDGSVLCTHGIDSAPAILSSSDTATVPRAPCSDSGALGPAVEVIYAVPQGTTSDYSNLVRTVRKKAAYADYYLDETNKRVDQHVRWLCNSRGKVAVRNVQTIPVSDSLTLDSAGNCVLQRGGDSAFTFRDMVCSLKNQVGLGLGSRNYDRQDRIYLVFMDKIANAYGPGYCGQGSLYNDDRATADNRNNKGPSYSLIACWDGGVVLHELGHNLGGVQLSAPHSSGGWHCYDLEDDMCYSDGGSYFTGGGSLLSVCLTSQDWHFDCGGDDYYNPAPPVGSYLATHWNVASSSFLTKPLSCPDSC